MTSRSTKPSWRKWTGRAFIAWGIFAFAYLFSGYRTIDVDGHILISDTTVSVVESAESLQFTPTNYDTALLFVCGSGVSAHAYAPMLRPIAEQGYGVFVIKLPYRFAAFDSHRSQAVDRAVRVIAEHPQVMAWVVSGHSLGGALACRIARDRPNDVAGLVLVGTTHPKSDDLSSVAFPVAKVYASLDGIAPVEKVDANKHLLPSDTRYILLNGGNHCQFGNYAGQFLDGTATISREQQQSATRSAILEMLATVGK